jgi:hypothetical protein
LVNYKKFKSLKKRFLMSNFGFYRSFLFLLKRNNFFNFNRLNFNKLNNNNTYIPTNFYLKRMFGKNTLLLNILDEKKIFYR